MPKKQWTTPNQRKWLEALLPDFVEAQENGSTRVFYQKVYEDWRKEFQPTQPTEAEVQKVGSAEQAKWVQKRAQENVSEDVTKDNSMLTSSCREYTSGSTTPLDSRMRRPRALSSP